MVSLQYVSFHGLINHFYVKKPCGKYCIDVASLQYVSLNVPLACSSWKAFSQLPHWKGFSTVCDMRCCIRLLLSEKALSQILHINNLSPVCDLSLFTKWYLWKKALCQKLHWCCFPPVCVLKCPISILLSKMDIHFYHIGEVSLQYVSWHAHLG